MKVDQSAEYERDWETTAKGLANENERLKGVIRMMCTEMPIGWEEVVRGAGFGFVVDLVQEVIEEAD